MRVLFLDQFSELGGAQQCLLDLVDGMPRGELHAALPSRGPLVEALEHRHVAVHKFFDLQYTNGRKTLRDLYRFALDTPRLAARVRALIRRHRIDLVYVNGPRMLAPAAMAAPKALVFHSHSYLGKRYASLVARLCLRNARVIASSRFVALPLPQHNLRVIYNGVRELPFQVHRGGDGRPWRIGIVGRIAPEKGQTDFLRMAHVLQHRGLNAEYRIHGAPMFAKAGYMEEVVERSRGLNVVFAGWSNDIAGVFAELDLLAVPSAAIDATPRVIMEAFAAGVPVAAYPSGGVPELIEDGVSGVLTSSSSAVSLADAIEGLLRGPERLDAIARAARSQWETRFTVQRYAREVQEFLATTQYGSKARQ
ncbi:MAG TPA: glycosyltransferase family 4 protein [Bryobacteraceae bacterium]|nr:glycosyltransferase family 4 protein [Bryobacteraceae bacterium]